MYHGHSDNIFFSRTIDLTLFYTDAKQQKNTHKQYIGPQAMPITPLNFDHAFSPFFISVRIKHNNKAKWR